MQKTAEKRIKNIRILQNLKIGKNGLVANGIVKQNRQFWRRTFKCQEHAEDDSNTTFLCSMKPFLQDICLRHNKTTKI